MHVDTQLHTHLSTFADQMSMYHVISHTILLITVNYDRFLFIEVSFTLVFLHAVFTRKRYNYHQNQTKFEQNYTAKLANDVHVNKRERHPFLWPNLLRLLRIRLLIVISMDGLDASTRYYLLITRRATMCPQRRPLSTSRAIKT